MSVWTRKTSGAYMTKLTSHQPPESELELSEPEISTEQPTHWQPIDPVGSQVLPSPFVCHQPCSLYTSLLDSIDSVASNIDTCQTCFLDFNFWLQTEHEVVKGYDEKYNMEEEDSFENKDKEQEEERQKMESERSKQPFKTSHWKNKTRTDLSLSGMSPTMSLVIGIIIGSFTAMILIVIIVLKVSCSQMFLSPSIKLENFGDNDLT